MWYDTLHDACMLLAKCPSTSWNICIECCHLIGGKMYHLCILCNTGVKLAVTFAYIVFHPFGYPSIIFGIIFIIIILVDFHPFAPMKIVMSAYLMSTCGQALCIVSPSFVKRHDTLDGFVVGRQGCWNWLTRYLSCCVPSGEDENEDGEEKLPSCSDYIMHFLTIFWKIIFATCPPTDLWGGWACFVVAIIFIGGLTAFIGDLASHFGCTIGLTDSVTAITFVALGTSIPGKLSAIFVVIFVWKMFIKKDEILILFWNQVMMTMMMIVRKARSGRKSSRPA